MAEVTQQFEPLRPKRQGKPKYPWQDWLNGEPWRLYAGEDFECQSASLVSSAAKFAGRNGFSVRSSISEDGLMVSLQAIQKRDGKGKR